MLHLGAQVHLFEPNLHLRYFLQKKFNDNKNAYFYPQAVWTKNTTTKFKIFANRVLSQGNRICDSKQEAKQAYVVDVIDLCEFLSNLIKKHKQIYLLKLDVEGVEFDIMHKILELNLHKNIEYIACEIHDYMFDDGKEKLETLQNAIKKANANNVLLDWV